MEPPTPQGYCSGQKRYAGAVDDAGEQIPPELVGTQPVFAASTGASYVLYFDGVSYLEVGVNRLRIGQRDLVVLAGQDPLHHILDGDFRFGLIPEWRQLSFSQ